MTAVLRLLRTAGWMLLAWTCIGIVFALPRLSSMDNWRQALLEPCIQWWSWGLVAPLIIAIDKRLPFTERQVRQRILTHIPLSLVLTCLYLYVGAAMRALFGMGSVEMVLGTRLLVTAFQGMILWSWLNYWLIFGLWLARQYYGRYVASELRMERMERLSTEARLHALRLQLDPHFLFNALNTISSQVEADPKLARRMIEHLGDLLRLTLETKDQPYVPLAGELAFLDHYLAIQRIRFGNRLRFELVVDDEVRYAMVPSMTIQPLVENALRHGISKRASGGMVRVTARREWKLLRVVVEDDGVGLPDNWETKPSNGLGLSVTRQRIEGLYPEREGLFRVRRREEGGTAVELLIPLAFEEPRKVAAHG